MYLVTKRYFRMFRHSGAVAVASAALFGAANAQPMGIAPAEEERRIRVQAAPPVDYSPAEVYRLETLEEVGSGFYTIEATGDTILKNMLARFAFGAAPEDQPSVEGGGVVMRRGGLLDVATDQRAAEGFHLFQPTVTQLGKERLAVDRLSSQREANDKASVTVEAHHLEYPDLKVRTEYLMFKDSPGVLVTTTIANESDETVAQEILPADMVHWGIMSPFMAGRGWVENQSVYDENVEFVLGRHDNQWILIAPDTGSFRGVARVGDAAMMLIYGDVGSMEPGETRIYRRWIMVGDVDPAMLFSAVLERRQDIEHGTLVGRVIEREKSAEGTMVDKAPVTDAEVFIAPLGRPGWTQEQIERFGNKPYIIARTNHLGQFQTLLPVGDYNVFPSTVSRIAPKPNYAASIRKGEVTGLDFGTSKSSRLIYKLIDADTKQPIAGKLTVEPLRGTKMPRFGDFGSLRSGNVLYSSYGQGVVDIPSGNYRIIASHGPEYHTTESRIAVRTTEDVDQVFELRRAYETPGWISADVGVRTNATPNVKVDEETRVVTGVAEGVDWLVSGDSNVATDLSDAVARLGLAGKIVTSPGLRRSGGTPPYTGDFLLFPANICSTGPNPDFTSVREAVNGSKVIEAMRAICPNGVILLSRATWPQIGYLTLNGFDRESGRLPEGDYSMDVDAFQIWEGKRQPLVGDDYMTYHAALRAGHRMSAFGNSNTEGTWMAETGYPRVYIKSSTDDLAKLNPEELALNIKKGLVSVTNGPFVNVKVNGQPMGSLVTDTDGEVEVEMEIYAANWVPINSISVNLNGQFMRKIILNPATLDREAGRIFPSADKPEEGKLTVSVKEDSVLDITVSGDLKSPMDPVNPFNAFTREHGMPTGQFAYAVSAPILIDTDGNGKLDLKELPKDVPVGEWEDPPF